jgi:predicted secreted protein
MSRVVMLALGLLLAGPAAADTLLHLSESARVMVRPDELRAMLRSEAVAATAAEAQAQVNTAMMGAVALARQAAGVTVTTGAYSVWPQTPSARAGRSDWRASQTLALHGGDAVVLLTLVGTLQQRGLAVSELGWQMAAETARRARAEAIKQALAGLRARADEAAGILGLRFDSFREVRLDAAHQQPMPMVRAMAAPAASMSSAPPPTVEAEEVPVAASVEADAVLK